jgi:hypothetical protein
MNRYISELQVLIDQSDPATDRSLDSPNTRSRWFAFDIRDEINTQFPAGNAVLVWAAMGEVEMQFNLGPLSSFNRQ